MFIGLQRGDTSPQYKLSVLVVGEQRLPKKRWSGANNGINFYFFT